jgi:hypothetical protein
VLARDPQLLAEWRASHGQDYHGVSQHYQQCIKAQWTAPTDEYVKCNLEALTFNDVDVLVSVSATKFCWRSAGSHYKDWKEKKWNFKPVEGEAWSLIQEISG